MNMSQQSTMFNRQYQNGYPPSQEPYQHESWSNTTARPPTTSTGYQSIIGRRRQIRHDDGYHDHTSIGNGYSSSLFLNPQQYPAYSEETNNFPPRFHRDMYHEQPDYLSENFNNNNNNHQPYAYAANGFHPINHQFIPPDYYQQYQDDELLRHRAQSTSSTASSDSINQIRLMQQRLPPTSNRNNFQLNQDNSQIPSGETTPSNGSGTSDSVFHRLAYTSTKASLSKSSSNLYANLPSRLVQQPIQTQQMKKPEEIDFDDSNLLPNEPNSESISAVNQSLSKCQRSRSVDGRARLKNAQNRLNNIQRSTTTNDAEENSAHQSSASTVPSSKFTPVNGAKRDNTTAAAPPPRVPISSRSNQTKRLPNGTHSSTAKLNAGRTRNSNGNLVETDNDENLSLNESYQPKIADTKTRITNHRHSTNHIQTSASTSSVNSTYHQRTKVPVPITSNVSGTDLYK